MNRARWLILILGPLPILGSSWAVSSWFKADGQALVMPNHVLPGHLHDADAADHPRAAGSMPQALAASCQTAADRLRGMLGTACQVIVRPPFVLAGDLTRGELETLHDETIAPAMVAMQNCYFDTPPSEPVTVLLFRGEESYDRHCELLFGDRGISIYGYYKPRLRTLVVNIATGNGTLLHELTHALVDFDFPGVPDWLNEGLASLHEQSRFRTDGRGPWIEGLVNWRLSGLQEVVRQGELASLAALVENPRFRGRGEGTNYAQARYFCLYMQKRGVLAPFYRAFRERQPDDPRGLRTLAEVFPGMPIDALDADFERWVLGLDEDGT